MRRIDRLSLLFGLALGFTLFSPPARSDGVRDNDPEHVRPIPPVGLVISSQVRQELTAGLAKLGALLETLRPHESSAVSPAVTKAWGRYADIAIFHRAVRVALEDREFFQVKEIADARRLLSIGLERAEQWHRGETPWLKKTGLVVRGYFSQIDGTPQPYGLVIPATYNFEHPTPRRLDIWFHGRGETLSEVNFITQRMTNPRPIAPADTLVLHPYGRYCNANKFAGEVDTFEALNAACLEYAVDPRLISARGFSMGGAACWQFAVHHPSAWFAATPGAGFSETPEFLNFFQKETLSPPWWEEKLWRWYDCPGYVSNLKNLPLVAYSGELDIQKQAADVMEAACNRAGMQLTHLIGPRTKHDIHPESLREIESRLTAWAGNVRQRTLPRHLEFVTYSLIYNQGGWVTLLGMREQWEKASVVAERRDDGEVFVKTENVTSLRLEFLKEHPARRLVMDGQPIPLAEGSKDASGFRLQAGRWNRAASPAGEELLPLRKQPDSCGPIDHAFMSSFIFVKPTSRCAHPAVQKWVEAEMERAIVHWRRQFRGDARVKLDTEITAADMQTSHLVLWGDPQSNVLLGKISRQLPIAWTPSAIQGGERQFDAAQHVLLAIYPNPLNPRRYVVLNSGFTYREYDYLNNARQTPKLPDWAVVDLRTPPNSRWPGKVVAADFFDDEWRIKSRSKTPATK